MKRASMTTEPEFPHHLPISHFLLNVAAHPNTQVIGAITFGIGMALLCLVAAGMGGAPGIALGLICAVTGIVGVAARSLLRNHSVFKHHILPSPKNVDPAWGAVEELTKNGILR